MSVSIAPTAENRRYTKPKGAIPDYNAPVILPRDRCKVEDLCGRLHRDLIKSARDCRASGMPAQLARQRAALFSAASCAHR